MRHVCRKSPYRPYSKPNPINPLTFSTPDLPALVPAGPILARFRRGGGRRGLASSGRRNAEKRGPGSGLPSKGGRRPGSDRDDRMSGARGILVRSGTMKQAWPARQGRCGKALNIATRRKLLKTLRAERSAPAETVFHQNSGLRSGAPHAFPTTPVIRGVAPACPVSGPSGPRRGDSDAQRPTPANPEPPATSADTGRASRDAHRAAAICRGRPLAQSRPGPGLAHGKGQRHTLVWRARVRPGRG